MSAANVHHSQALPPLLHGEETRLGRLGIHRSDRTHQGACAQRPGLYPSQGHAKQPALGAEKTKNTTKSKVRAKVEHAFLIIKRILGFAKVRNRDLMRMPIDCS
jgi:IS5 family transposase